MAHSMPLRLVGSLLDTVDRATGARTDGAGEAVTGGADYEASIDAAVRAALRTSTAGVVVVLAPVKDNGGVKERLASTVAQERVRLVDLADDPRMLDGGLRLDGFSFSAGGHAIAALNVAPAVLGLIEHAERRTP